MSNGPPKKTKVRRLAKVLGAVVLMVIGLVLFASIKTPLHYAAWKNAAETAQLLITWGANVNAKDTLGRTPLHWAAMGNAAETAKVLLTQGAKINEKGQQEMDATTRGGVEKCD